MRDQIKRNQRGVDNLKTHNEGGTARNTKKLRGRGKEKEKSG